MAQVITQPQLGQQEEESKNWYRAEALRKISNELQGILNCMPNGIAREKVVRALNAIADARKLLSPQQKG